MSNRKMPLNEKDFKYIIRQLWKGRTQIELAAEFGYQATYLNRLLRPYKEKLPPKKDWSFEEAKGRAEAGERLRDIAKSYGITQGWLRRAFQRAGYKPPSHHGRILLNLQSVKEAVAAHSTLQKAATALGVSKSRLLQECAAHDIPTNDRVPWNRAEAQARIEAGESMTQVAASMGRSLSAMSRWFTRKGITFSHEIRAAARRGPHKPGVGRENQRQRTLAKHAALVYTANSIWASPGNEKMTQAEMAEILQCAGSTLSKALAAQREQNDAIK